MATQTDVRPATLAAPLLRSVTWWSLAFPAGMLVALAAHSVFLLNWVHVLSGVLWTGADLFMGFILGPVLRRLDPAQRTAVITYLVPRQLLYFPALSVTTGTAGWYLATWLGMLQPVHPQFPWVVAALVIITLLTLIGLGVMLPNSVRMWLELQKPQPDRDRVIALNRINIRLSGAQGLMQIAIIFVMAHFVAG